MKSYLVREKGIYYFRTRVPKDLVKKLKYREIKKSLRTTDLQKAQNIANFLHEYTDDLFKRVRSKMLSKSQVKQLVEAKNYFLIKLLFFWGGPYVLISS